MKYIFCLSLRMLDFRALVFAGVAFIAFLALPLPIFAEDDVIGGDGNLSVSLALTSQYQLRGLSLSDEDPVPQGSIDYAHDSGFYAGVWASPVDFNDGGKTDAEVDLYAGYARTYGKLTGDIRFYYYLYPGAPSGSDYDFFETYLALSYAEDLFSVQASLNATPDNLADSGNAFYPKLTVTAPLQKYPVTFDAHVARQYVEDNAAYGFPDYSEWGLGATYSTKWVDIRAEYIDTSADNSECIYDCEAKGVLTFSHKFTLFQ